MDSTSSLPATEMISAHLRTILRGVLAVLGMWRLNVAQMRLVYRRINKTFQEIERMLVRFRAGTLRRRVQQRDAVGGTRVRVAGRGPALPRRFGWLVIAGGYQAAGYGSQLQTVLNAPEMVELLAASAQARRILRPLCRALAVELPWVVPAPRKPTTRKVRARVKPEPFRIPLPRGMLTWARREGFGKIR